MKEILRRSKLWLILENDLTEEEKNEFLCDMLQRFNLNLDELYDLIIKKRVDFINNIDICKIIFESLLYYQIDNMKTIGHRLLLFASKNGYFEIIKYLINDSKIPLDIITFDCVDNGYMISYATLIYYASLYGRNEIVKYLIACEDKRLLSYKKILQSVL